MDTTKFKTISKGKKKWGHIYKLSNLNLSSIQINNL